MAGENTAQSNIINVGFLLSQFQRFKSESLSNSSIGVKYNNESLGQADILCSYPFMSTAAAYKALLSLRSHVYTACRSVFGYGEIEIPLPEVVYSACLLFTKWESRFTTFLKERYIQGTDEECVLSLQNFSIATKISLFVQRPTGVKTELMYDVWNPSFRKMADLTEQLHDVITRDMISPQPTHRFRPFSLTSSISLALAVACRCRDGLIRRRIVALLRKWPFDGGITGCGLAGAVIKAWMLAEEEEHLLHDTRPDGCHCVTGQYICVMHRYVGARPVSLMQRSAIMLLALPGAREGLQNMVWRKAMLEWWSDGAVWRSGNLLISGETGRIGAGLCIYVI